MAHYSRERSDLDWYRGLKVPETVIRNIDQKTAEAVSGTGGTYNPSAPIVIDGAGLELQCVERLSGGAKVQPAPGKSYTFGDDDYFRILNSTTGATTTVRIINDACAQVHEPNDGFPRDFTSDKSFIDATLTPALTGRRRGASVRMPLRIPDGTSLEGVRLYLATGTTHASLPAILPKMRVVQIDADGNITPYGTIDTTSGSISNMIVEPDGWVRIAPTSATTYDSSHATQTMEVYFPATAPVADRSLYDYALEFVEEDGANAFDDSNMPTSSSGGTRLYTMKLFVVMSQLQPY